MSISETKQVKLISSWLGTGSINVFGQPFSGKDTQARRISQFLSAPIIGGGDIIRNSSENEEIKKIISGGNLAPQKDYLKLVIPYLSLDEFRNKPLVLNSVGRWHGEEEPILGAAHLCRHPIKAVIHLDIDETEVWKRRKAAFNRKDRGFRSDDNDLSLKKRLLEYKQKTFPIFAYYNDKGLLITVNGKQNKDAVTEEIISKLYQKIISSGLQKQT